MQNAAGLAADHRAAHTLRSLKRFSCRLQIESTAARSCHGAHCRGMSPVGMGEELTKPADVPLLLGQVCCGPSTPVQKALHNVMEAEPVQMSLEVGPKIKLDPQRCIIQLLTESQWKLQEMSWQGQHTGKRWREAPAREMVMKSTFTAIFSHECKYRHIIPCLPQENQKLKVLWWE